MNAIKNLAVKEGHTPPALAQQVGILKQHGRLYEIDDFDNNKRASMGLPKIEKSKGFTKRIIEVTDIEILMEKSQRGAV